LAAEQHIIQYRQLKTKKTGQFYHKLPSLEELECLIYEPLLWGAPLLVAAVGIGFLWSKTAFGEFWFSDPKTITTVFIAFFYLGILYLHYVSSLRGKKVAILSVIAFALVLVSFVGTRLIEGNHYFSG